MNRAQRASYQLPPVHAKEQLLTLSLVSWAPALAGDKLRSYSIKCRLCVLRGSPTPLGVPLMYYFSSVCYQIYRFTRSPFRPRRDPSRQDSHLFISGMVRSFGCLPFNESCVQRCTRDIALHQLVLHLQIHTNTRQGKIVQSSFPEMTKHAQGLFLCMTFLVMERSSIQHLLPSAVGTCNML